MLHPDPKHLEVADADSFGFPSQMNAGQSSGQRWHTVAGSLIGHFPQAFMCEAKRQALGI